MIPYKATLEQFNDYPSTCEHPTGLKQATEKADWWTFDKGLLVY